MSVDATAVPLTPPPPKDPARQATVEALLTDIFRMMEYPARVELKDAEDGGLAVAVHFEHGPPQGVVPGKKNHLVDCVQFLVNKATNRPNTERRWVSLAVGGFPEARPLRGVPNPQRGGRDGRGGSATLQAAVAQDGSGGDAAQGGSGARSGSGAEGDALKGSSVGSARGGRGARDGSGPQGGNGRSGPQRGNGQEGDAARGGAAAQGGADTEQGSGTTASGFAARPDGRGGRRPGPGGTNGPHPSGPPAQGRRESDEAGLAVPPNPALEALGAQLAAKSAKYGRHLAVLLASPEARASLLKGAAGAAEVTVRAEGEQVLRRVAFVPHKPSPMPKKNALPIDDEE